MTGHENIGRRDCAFLADAMLGTLARKLRMLGVDVVLAGDEDDSIVKYRVRSEGRILLTRDTGLATDLGRLAFLVGGNGVQEEFRSVIPCLRKLQCTFAPMSRCLGCNGVLEEVGRTEVVAVVPHHALKNSDRFKRCGGCGKVYWPGTHSRRMAEEIEGLLAELEAPGDRG